MRDGWSSQNTWLKYLFLYIFLLNQFLEATSNTDMFSGVFQVQFSILIFEIFIINTHSGHMI